ncbi:hypothetical protein TRFO_31837 [Tritrichomonas foetus]|uniref:Importin N-terminal domain-containing protein n=1 Tax=Tritrichomonas foetus TaxID=1144522 RepID=A0A1J4JV37_9EUKA|nr:hypothetical protein TRFO_31837 [Tritrichomonas foetus]|eukprot:OHT01398.1 hypothetical protein TRFO_31837 [Tritrichomonas foetus]
MIVKETFSLKIISQSIISNSHTMADLDLSQHIAYLINTLSQEEGKRNEANEYLMNLLQNETPTLVQYSCHVVMSDKTPISAVQLSFILLHKSTDFIISEWFRIDPKHRDFIKQAIVRGLFFDDLMIRNVASVVFSRVAKTDITCGFNYEIFNVVTQPIFEKDYEMPCKVGCVFAMSELIANNVVSPKTPNYNLALTLYYQFLIFILQNHEQLQNERKLLLEKYIIILPFFKPCLKNVENRMRILNELQSLFEVNDNVLSDTLFKFLAMIFRTCYSFPDFPKENMGKIFEYTAKALESENNPELIVSALYFWINVAQFENRLIIQKRNDFRLGKESDIIIHNIIAEVTKALIPPLVQIMITNSKDEPVNELNGEINVCAVVAECLKQFGKLTLDVFNFIATNFESMRTHQNWQVRHTSLILLYCITSSSNYFDQLNFLGQNILNITSMVNDNAYIVKDAALWITDVIFSTYKEIGTDDKFIEIVQSIIANGPVAPSILAIRICDLVRSIGELYRDLCDQSVLFSSMYEGLIDVLFTIFDRSDAVESLLGNHCTEAISSMIRSSPVTYEQFIINILGKTVEKIRNELQSFNITMNSVHLQTKLQLYCIIIWSIAKRLGPAIEPYSEPVLQMLFHILQMKSVICQEDGLIALSALINALGEKIFPQAPQIIQIFKLSQESGSKEIIKTSAAVIHCMFKSLGHLMKNDEVNQEIVRIFIAQLQNENLDISAKVEILFAFAEMIRVLKDAVAPAFDIFVGQLLIFQNSIASYDPDNTILIFESLLKGYSSLIEASKNNDYINLIVRNYRKSITPLFEKMCKYTEYFTPMLNRAILDYLRIALNAIAPRVNHQLNKRCVTSIVEQIASSDENTELSFKASIILKEIKNC